MTELTPDELTAFDHELRQRDPRFLRILSADADGQGTYELRSATTGATLTSAFTLCAEHRRVQSPNIPEEARAWMAEASAAAPDPYKKPWPRCVRPKRRPRPHRASRRNTRSNGEQP